MRASVLGLSAAFALSIGGLAHAAPDKGETVKLNPQPEPPGVQAKHKLNKGEAVKLNPQPEPPGVQAKHKLNKGEAVKLNPQPEPPGVQAKAACKGAKSKTKGCAAPKKPVG